DCTLADMFVDFPRPYCTENGYPRTFLFDSVEWTASIVRMGRFSEIRGRNGFKDIKIPALFHFRDIHFFGSKHPTPIESYLFTSDLCRIIWHFHQQHNITEMTTELDATSILSEPQTPTQNITN